MFDRKQAGARLSLSGNESLCITHDYIWIFHVQLVYMQADLWLLQQILASYIAR